MAAVGLGASYASWKLARNAEDRALTASFDLEARGYFDRLEQDIALFMDVLDSIRHLHTISERISREDFREFVTKGMVYQQQVLGSFGFALHVPAGQRAAFEQSPDGPAPILEAEGANPPVRAGERADYFPVTFCWPPDQPGLRVGLDLAAREQDRLAIARMQDTGAMVLGSDLSTPGADHGGRLVYSPIFIQLQEEDGASLFYLRGFAFAVLMPGAILHRVIPPAAAESVRIELQPPGYPAPARTADPVFSAPLSVAGEPWTFRCLARPGYFAARRTRQPETFLIAGSVVTLLATLLVGQLAGRARRVEKLVAERTAALSEANRQLGAEREECLRLEHEMLEVSSREKQRVGQDLHDSLGQKLAGAVFLSRALSTHLQSAGPEPGEDARKINEILKDAVSQVRRLARGLAPVELGEGGLPGALRQLAAETCDTFGVICSFRPEGPSNVIENRATMHLYHIAQEAVTNAIRHGKAREVVIELDTASRPGRLAVSDNGSGFDPAALPEQGLGLRIMRYRASMFGGSIEIARRAEGGMRIECAFPVRA
jgi:signal transduction histidine kinase